MRNSSIGTPRKGEPFCSQASHSTPGQAAACRANRASHHSTGWIVQWAFSPFGRCFCAG